MSELERHAYEEESQHRYRGVEGSRRRQAKRARRASAGVPGMSLRSEVEVLDWGPDRGNPTSMRQGRGPEVTGRFQCGCVRCGASVRAGLKEAVDAWWWRTRVKRRKASLVGELACGSDARFLLVPGTYWRRDHREISTTYPGRSVGLRGSVGRRQRRLMAQQKSEDRVVPDGGVMPVQPAGSSPGGQGKAVPVDEAVSQLRLTIATAEAPNGGSVRRSPDRFGGRAVGGAPKAIVIERTCEPATMEEVVERLGSALVKVVANKGAHGPDAMTVDALRAQWPQIVPRLGADLLEGRWRPGEIRRALIPKAGGGERGLGSPTWQIGW